MLVKNHSNYKLTLEASRWNNIVQNTSDTDVDLLTDNVSDLWGTIVVDNITIISFDAAKNVEWRLVESNTWCPHQLIVFCLWWSHLWVKQCLS